MIAVNPWWGTGKPAMLAVVIDDATRDQLLAAGEGWVGLRDRAWKPPLPPPST